MGSTKLTFTQSCDSNLEGCFIEQMPIREVCDNKKASLVMASRVSSDMLGLRIELNGID